MLFDSKRCLKPSASVLPQYVYDDLGHHVEDIYLSMPGELLPPILFFVAVVVAAVVVAPAVVVVAPAVAIVAAVVVEAAVAAVASVVVAVLLVNTVV
jgi:hypothetical protein